MKTINPLVNLSEFFQQRKALSETLNNEIIELKAKLKAQTMPVILFSLQMENTTVDLGKDIREVFNYQFHKYPEGGLVLQTVEVSFVSTVGNDFSFGDYLDLTFKMGDENWNGQVQFLKLTCNDEKQIIIDNSMGICYNPRFHSVEKYAEVKDFIQSVQKQVKEYFE